MTRNKSVALIYAPFLQSILTSQDITIEKLMLCPERLLDLNLSEGDISIRYSEGASIRYRL